MLILISAHFSDCGDVDDGDNVDDGDDVDAGGDGDEGYEAGHDTSRWCR